MRASYGIQIARELIIGRVAAFFFYFKAVHACRSFMKGAQPAQKREHAVHSNFVPKLGLGKPEVKAGDGPKLVEL